MLSEPFVIQCMTDLLENAGVGEGFYTAEVCVPGNYCCIIIHNE